MNDVEIKRVTKSYGQVTALEDVSLAVEAGTTFGLLGTNGAGKTTLFRLLIGHEAPDAGAVEIAGLPAERGVEVRRRVGYLPEHAGFPPSFTGREVLGFHADVRGVPATVRDERIAAALATVGLADAADRSVGGYSNGMNRRLGLATVLLTEPQVLLLDEPTAGLDPMGVDAFNRIVERIAAETPITIVFSSHSHAEVERVCDQVAILDDGRVCAAGDVDDLRRDVGETVTIDLRIGEDDSPSAVADRLRDAPGVTSAEPSDDRGLRVRCARPDTYGVLSMVHDVAAVDGFEVREPSIEDVFREAIDGGVSDASGDQRVGSGPTGGAL
ncbi:ATP-binding cassette domain-containing protein [Halorientalis brevis]|uniref:ATP-binding cassette domain-containing protein n=1 Tax=Halorientalis brevis TaxID=1126241 RepID=A0ABD6CAE1_9EURY|nr:ABC transporter ATP-binding protein [Halorientalis brevis]